MNKKNKILISAAGMLILTAAAASASTFAWFTTVRNATIAYSQASVYTDSGSLEVTYKSSLLSTWTSTPAGATANLVLGGSHSITDISGDGSDFYKPVWNAFDTSSTTADSISAITSTNSGDADGYYIDFTVTIARTNPSGTGMKVYLGPDTAILPATALDLEDEAAVAAARFAVIESTTNAPKMIWAPENDGVDLGDYMYIDAGTPGVDTAYTVDGFKLVDQEGVGGVADLVWSTPITEYTTIAAADAAGNMPSVVDLSTAVSSDVTFRAWIEGTDPECTNTAIAGLFNLNISLYGLAVA